MCLRAGGTLRLFVTVTGRPTPVVAWRKKGVELQRRGYIETTDSYTMLMVEKVDRYDSGKYILEAENPSGKKTATILVKVYGRSSNRYQICHAELVLYFCFSLSRCISFAVLVMFFPETCKHKLISSLPPLISCRHSWSSRFCEGEGLHQGVCRHHLGRPKR